MVPEKRTLKLKDGVELNLEIIESNKDHWLIVNHGMGEHLGRHQYFYDLFSEKYNICMYDLRGHGKSTGKKAYIENFDIFIKDLNSLKEYLQGEYEFEKFSLFGHSMGALIVSSYIQDELSREDKIAKVFLSNPPVSAYGVPGHFFDSMPFGIVRKIKSIPFSLPLKGVLDLNYLSHDPRVKEKYLNDNLNLVKIHSKLFFEVLNKAKNVYSKPLRADCELFCAIGTEDRLVNPKASLEYFENLEKNCKVLEIKGGFHELHNEVQRYKAPYLEFLSNSLDIRL